MIEIIYTPKWFYGKDLIIDIFSLCTLWLIAFFTMQFYKLDKKNKKHKYLSISFFMLGLSFIFKILTNFTIFYNSHETARIGFVQFTYHTWKSTDTLFFGGFLMYRLLTVAGLYLLYIIYQNQQSKSNMFLTMYLITFLIYFSQAQYFIFYFTNFIILGLISYRILGNYRKTKHNNTLFLLFSFLLITLCQIFFMLIKFNETYYAIAMIFQLFGYVLLLGLFIRVLKYGKKKK